MLLLLKELHMKQTCLRGFVCVMNKRQSLSLKVERIPVTLLRIAFNLSISSLRLKGLQYDGSILVNIYSVHVSKHASESMEFMSQHFAKYLSLIVRPSIVMMPSSFNFLNSRKRDGRCTPRLSASCFLLIGNIIALDCCN